MLSLRRQRVAVAAVRPGGPTDVPFPAALLSLRKRALDVILSGALLLVSMPAWIAIAIAIKLTSPGPILFRQERVGCGAVPFTVLKFRTMRHGAPDHVHRLFVTQMIVSGVTSLDGAPSGGTFKLTGDARITRIGRILRRTSLDELPQLINVLRGEMSLIGPRPPLAYEVDRYESWQRERLSVLPGITGLWQVSGRNRLSYLEMCRLDVGYVRDWSFGRDLAILVRTPWAMFVDRGGAS
jgi:lipopolysaccharide/colanic/teichoic acid biosynthesis glycosyltransferase